MRDLIYVKNNELQSVAPPSIKEFCMAAPRGAYTTLQIANDYFAVDFSLHIERLIKSIAAVHATLNSCYANYYTALARGQDSQEALVLQAAVLPSLLLALTTAEKRCEQETLKLATIIVSPSEDQTTPASSSSLSIHVAVAPDPRCLQLQENTFATVLGPPREVPIGKDSGWVAQRQTLEALRPPGAAEILLTTQQGALLEGLVTNLFIITRSKDGEIVLQTAGMGDGVVWGTMRKRVSEACKQLGLKVLEQPPAAAERATWQEAFLTNALRGVQPLDRIECDERNVWGLEPWVIEFLEVPGQWTAKIQALVESSLQRTDLRNLS
ncbi:hypothetical protein Ndes2526B_g06197 [Nannochloris sp. 'desiccata']